MDQLSDIVDVFGIEVWCFGIRTDFKTRLFPGSKRLFEISDKIDCIKSSCTCGGKNIINARIDKDGNIVSDGDQYSQWQKTNIFQFAENAIRNY